MNVCEERYERRFSKSEELKEVAKFNENTYAELDQFIDTKLNKVSKIGNFVNEGEI